MSACVKLDEFRPVTVVRDPVTIFPDHDQMSDLESARYSRSSFRAESFPAFLRRTHYLLDVKLYGEMKNCSAEVTG